MARPEVPIDYTVPEVGELADHLRARRAAAGLTYSQLAKSTPCSSASLKRAARGGARPPEWRTVCDYVRACGGVEEQVEQARVLWERAEAAAEAAARDARRSTVVPKPQLVRDEGDLSGALRDAYRRAGSPPVRQMEERAGPGRLSRSTAHAIITGHALPKDIRIYIAFLEMCEISGPDLLDPWFAAWAKVRPPYGHEPVFLARHRRPNEELFLEWFAKYGPVVHVVGPSEYVVVDGQQSLSAVLDRLYAQRREVDIAA